MLDTKTIRLYKHIINYTWLALTIAFSIYWIWFMEHNSNIICYGLPLLAMIYALSEFSWSWNYSSETTYSDSTTTTITKKSKSKNTKF